MKKSFFLTIFLVIIFSAIFFIGAKFMGTAANIYEFENPSKTEIINQFKKILLDRDNELRKNPNGETNILLLGVAGAGHNGENLTDTIMILSISADQKKVTIKSIPRDLYIELPESQYWGKINAVYAYRAKDNPRDGIKILSQEIKQITGIPINYYVIANFEGFKKVVDIVGGVDYTLEEDLNDPAFPNDSFGYDPLFMKAGTYHLDGALALKLARSRHNIEGDFSRIKRQHKIIYLLKDKIEKNNLWDNFFKVTDILNVIGENIKTDISLPQLQKLSSIAKSIQETESKIPNSNMEVGLLKAANVGGADVLLPKDPSYDELRAFYQDDKSDKQEATNMDESPDSETTNLGSETTSSQVIIIPKSL
jgi:LCP family protein required for cell wall assembly